MHFFIPEKLMLPLEKDFGDDYIPLKLSSHLCRHTHRVSHSSQLSGSVPCSDHHCVCVWIILRWIQTSCSLAFSDPPKHGMHDLRRQYFRSSSVLHLNQWAALSCDSDHPRGQLHEMSLNITCWLLTLFPLGLLQRTPWALCEVDE